MALIDCPECGNEISDQAKSCPECGLPIASGEPGTAETVEQTSKTYKAQQVLAIFVAVVGGIGVCGFNSPDGGEPNYLAAVFALVCLGGMLWYIGARAAAWWDHG